MMSREGTQLHLPPLPRLRRLMLSEGFISCADLHGLDFYSTEVFIKGKRSCR